MKACLLVFVLVQGSSGVGESCLVVPCCLAVGDRLCCFARSNIRSCSSSIEIDVSETVRFPQRSEVESCRQQFFA